ncbi:chorismate synthase [Anaeromicropila herbilytica]|uniref:Chorismate synthase n=1 Tax=Anaeromicropila herbilytica TaxID=2785025 RepID=A0A7R7EP00_9FIRM|nr:chorismate synthase [Anaeromicropila herbilytica]BCN31982.1 chorismate synthase [Anaeromicropila herbilytica]
MSGSIYGNLFRISSWGESHGKGIGVVVDGCPAGLSIDEAIIQTFLDRRKPGQTKYSTPRVESDKVEILSGTFENLTTGTPISMVVMNQSQRSSDYSDIASYYRPGHADYTYDEKYGFRDYRGGGRSSGRETIARVAAGAIASSILKELGISVFAYTKSIGNITINESKANLDDRMKSPFYMPDLEASLKAEDFLQEQMLKKDSVGGIIECIVTGMPVGVGEPNFDKLDANLAKAVMSIGSVKGIEFGSGFESANSTGSINNDNFRYVNGILTKDTNHSGGILGGLSDGSDIVLRAAIKPTPSIASTQETVNKDNENISINIKGRHDPIIVPRAVVVVESMVAITLVDMLFMSMTSRMDNVKEFFKK